MVMNLNLKYPVVQKTHLQAICRLKGSECVTVDRDIGEDS